MNDVLVRALSGLAYVVLVLLACFTGQYSQIALAIVFSAIGVIEWLKFSGLKANVLQNTSVIALIILSILLVNLDLNPFTTSVLLLALVLVLLGLFAGLMFFTDQGPTRLTHSVFAIAYVGIPLMLLPKVSIFSSVEFPWILASIFILIWCNDTFAYLSGRAFGKNKLFERISPNKTWEGFFGGVIVTVIASIVMQHYLPFLPLHGWMGLALIVSIFGNLGDLFESSLKRNFNLKDSGKLMPGHGGILDRLDSLFFVLPVSYFYLRILETTTI